MRRVVINGKQYAVGLDCFPLREQSKPEVIQEAEANYPDSNLVVMLKEQYGLGESGKSGVASWKRTSALAAALLPYTDAVHVFTLIDADTNKPFWWVFGVRKGLISAQSADFSDEMSANEYAAAMFDSLGVPESDAFDVQTSLALLSERLAAQKKRVLGCLSTCPSSGNDTGQAYSCRSLGDILWFWMVGYFHSS